MYSDGSIKLGGWRPKATVETVSPLA
jgi:hypothetical protein